MKTLVITGANRGLGMEAAVLFARQSDFQRIILTVRSEAKGVAAVVAASEASGAPASRFRFQVMDLESHQNVTKTAMTWLGAGHSLDVGAKRYVEAVSAASFPDRFPSGSVVGGGSWMGTSGALVEQSSFSSVYTDTAMQEEAARVVRAAMLQ